VQCLSRGYRVEERRLCVNALNKKYPDEFCRRAVDEALDRGRKISDVAGQVGITSPETLRRWVRQAEADRGLRQGPTTGELAEIKGAAEGGGRPAADDRDPKGGQ
jgi:transposase-like protein